MANETKFVLAADEAKAVQAFLKVLDAQKKSVAGFKEQVREGNAFMKSLEGIGTGIAGAFSVQKVTAFVEAYKSGMKEVGNRNVSLQDSLTNLMSQDDNVKKMGELRDEVLAFAGAWSLTVKEVADARAEMQTGLAHMAVDQRGVALSAAKLNKALGIDFTEAANVNIKALQAWGDELDGESERTDKLAKFLNDLSGVGNPAEYMSAVALDAKRASVSMNEFFATVDLVSTLGGKKKESIGALKLIFKGIADGIAEGTIQATSFEDELKQIAKLDPFTRKKLFPEGASAEIDAINLRLEELKRRIEEFKNMHGGETEGKLGTALGDPQKQAAEVSKVMKSASENVTTLQDAGQLHQMNDEEARDLYWKWATSPGAKRFGLDKTSSAIGSIMGWLGGGGNDFGMKDVRQGYLLGSEKAAAGGQQQLSDILRLRGGGLHYSDIGTPDQRDSGQGDADIISDLFRRGYKMDRSTQDQYLRARRNDPKWAAQMERDLAPSQAGGNAAGQISDLVKGLAAIMVQHAQALPNFTTRPRPQGN